MSVYSHSIVYVLHESRYLVEKIILKFNTFAFYKCTIMWCMSRVYYIVLLLLSSGVRTLNCTSIKFNFMAQTYCKVCTINFRISLENHLESSFFSSSAGCWRMAMFAVAYIKFARAFFHMLPYFIFIYFLVAYSPVSCL